MTIVDNEFSVGVQTYISQVLSYPKLTAKEERELFKTWRKKKKLSAKSTILISNLRYVVAIALGYKCYPVSIDELISEGNLGLLVAFDKYKSTKGTRFITYAAYWVRAFMLSLIIRASLGGRTGAGPYRSKIFFKIRREKARSLSKYGNCEAAYKDLAKKMQLPMEKVFEMTAQLESPDISLDNPIKKNSVVTLKDFMSDDRPSPEEVTMNQQKRDFMKQIVQIAMESLDRREKYIIQKRIFDDEGVSLAEIGRDLGVSRERARQLEGRAKKKIRTSLENSGIFNCTMIS